MRKFALILCAVVLSGCGVVKTIPTSTETDYSAKRDSVYVKDSVYIDRWHTVRVGGDTVYITDTRVEYKYRYRDREVHDTTYVDKEVTVIKEVPAKLTWWQSFRLKAFWWLGGFILIVIILFILKLKKK